MTIISIYIYIYFILTIEYHIDRKLNILDQNTIFKSLRI